MSLFSHDRYELRKQAIALTGRFRVFDMQGNQLMFSQQKAFKLREDIRVYTDEQKTNEVLYIQARQIIDFSAAYDVIDSSSGQKVGALRRRGMKSLVQDEWEFLNASDVPFAVMKEDSLFLALFRRILSGLVPQNYDVLINGQRVADLKQNFNPFTYRLTMDFSMDSMSQIDRRLGIAAGILLAAIEGRQR